MAHMDFDHSERAHIVMEQVERFIRERVVPNEATYQEQLTGSPDWTRWRVPPIVEQLKGRQRSWDCGTCSSQTRPTVPG